MQADTIAAIGASAAAGLSLVNVGYQAYLAAARPQIDEKCCKRLGDAARVNAEVSRRVFGAPGRNRTCDTRFRKPVLYPLSYEGS
jgi:hypothetical protein